MSLENKTDLKSVMRLVHQQGVVTADYLRRQGVSYQRMMKYRRSGWFAALGRGAFCESGTHPSFEQAVAALATQDKIPVHYCGKTALFRRGIMHFVPLGDPPADLHLRRGVRLPKWFADKYGGCFVLNSSLVLPEGLGVEGDAHGVGISSPERAFLELASLVPVKMALGELYQLMESAETLRPRLLESLLVGCTSVKAKRIFLMLADDLGHWWAKKLNRGRIDLGTGCRVIDKGGTLQHEYNVVVKPWRDNA